jgi:hypothetical protein
MRIALYATVATLFLSGLASLFAPSVSMVIHGAAAMVVLALAGATFALHVPAAWGERRNRTSGMFMVTVLVLLAVSGCLLYYAGSEAVRSAASIGHWVVGVALVPIIAWHAISARRGALAARALRDSEPPT